MDSETYFYIKRSIIFFFILVPVILILLNGTTDLFIKLSASPSAEDITSEPSALLDQAAEKEVKSTYRMFLDLSYGKTSLKDFLIYLQIKWIALLFIYVILVAVAWLVIRFSSRIVLQRLHAKQQEIKEKSEIRELRLGVGRE